MPIPAFDLGVIASIPARSAWDHEFTLYEPNATSTDAGFSAVLAAGDIARFRLFASDNVTPLITATDQTASANGTTVTINTRGTADTTPARVTVDFDDADLYIDPGNYLVILDIKDASDSSRWQPACYGTIRVIAGPA